MFWIIILSFVAVIALFITVYMMPSDNAHSKKKKEKKVEVKPDLVPVDKSKDWKAIAERWERNNTSLHGEIEKMKMDHKKVQQDIDAQKAQNKELMEKLGLEKGWREKEQVTLDKYKQHEKDFKGQIQRTEADLEKEHSNRLRLERELQEMKIKHEQVIEEKREATVKSQSLETTVSALQKELRELKSENARLKEKREDIQWVAKSEFDELKSKFQQTQQELARLKPNG